MTGERRGALLAIVSAFLAAAFLIPYKQASLLGDREAVVLAMLLAAAAFNTVGAFVEKRTEAAPLASGLGGHRVTVVTTVVLAVFTVGGNWAVAEALTRITPGLTSVLQQTQILLVAVCAVIFLGERVTARLVGGMLLALGGFAVMSWPGSEGWGADLGGMLLALLSAVCFGLMHVVVRKAIHRIRPVLVNALRLWTACLLLSIVSGGPGRLGSLSLEAWSFAALAAFFGPFLSRVAIMWAVRHIPASQSALLALVAPVFAFVLGFLVFGEAPTAREVGGGLVILAGIALPLFEPPGSKPTYS